jgi:hypothetical protein
MPDQFVLPRLDAGSASAEQKGTVRGRQRRAAKRSGQLSIVNPRPSRRKIILGRMGILTALGASVADCDAGITGRVNRDLRTSTDRRRRIAVR